MLVAVLLVVWSTAAGSAQTVPVTVEVAGSDTPPTEGPTDSPWEQPTSPGSAPPNETPSSPAPPPEEEPPPVAADPPEDPLARTGANVLRIVRDAAALIAAGLLLLVATREPRRERA